MKDQHRKRFQTREAATQADAELFTSSVSTSKFSGGEKGGGERRNFNSSAACVGEQDKYGKKDAVAAEEMTGIEAKTNNKATNLPHEAS